MNLRQLKYFIATAELGQVSRAASELRISQSSITTAVRELEQDLDVILFVRTAHGMELTPPGRELLGAAREIMEKPSSGVSYSVLTLHLVWRQALPWNSSLVRTGQAARRSPVQYTDAAAVHRTAMFPADAACP